MELQFSVIWNLQTLKEKACIHVFSERFCFGFCLMMKILIVFKETGYDILTWPSAFRFYSVLLMKNKNMLYNPCFPSPPPFCWMLCLICLNLKKIQLSFLSVPWCLWHILIKIFSNSCWKGILRLRNMTFCVKFFFMTWQQWLSEHTGSNADAA